MPAGNPEQPGADRMWWPADDLDRVLEYVWGGCLSATNSKDRQEDIHDCSVCGDPHMILDEARYVDDQAAHMAYARRLLDGVIQGLTFDEARKAAWQIGGGSTP